MRGNVHRRMTSATEDSVGYTGDAAAILFRTIKCLPAMAI